MLTPLQEARRAYIPKLPKALQDLSKVHLVSQEQVSVRPEIEELFPHMKVHQVIRGEVGTPRSFKPLRVGVVFSGGPAPGGHNVIVGLLKALKAMDVKSSLFGFLDGPSGIVGGKSVEITEASLAPYVNQGGFDLLGSGRTKIETQEQLQDSLTSVQKLGLDGLVVIGGDDSNTNAAVLAEYFMQNRCQTRVVGVPKTIDGDLKNSCVSLSFGFDTATKVYAELIGNLARDTLSSRKGYHFVRLMGRSASHITLECALATHPNLVLISEEKKTLSQIIGEICDLIQKRAKLGKNYGVVLIPEGLVEMMPGFAEAVQTLPERIRAQLLLERDPHGNLNVSAIETELLLIELTKIELQKQGFTGKWNAIPHFLGYEGRSALPTNFDANYCVALGHVAALLLQEGLTGMMAFVGNLEQPPEAWSLGGIPLVSLMHLEVRHGVQKPVIAKALVDLQSTLYQEFKKASEQWALEDDYRIPGPIQFFGDAALTDTIPHILQ